MRSASYQSNVQLRRSTYGISAFVIAAIFTWSYWPTMVGLVNAWMHQTDYAHGFFVLPLAMFFLVWRRSSFPGIVPKVHWLGLSLVLVSIGLRYLGWRYFLSPLDGWSMIFWLAGAVWLLGGWSVLKWAWPSIAFLLFMVPLHWQLEMALSLPLQGIATTVSAWILQVVGQPAVVEGHTIYLDGQSLEVAAACSGLRIFMTSLAFGSAVAILFGRHWIDCLIILMATVPIAVLTNSIRIALTGTLFRYASAALETEAIHDWPGLVMLPLTAALFGGLVWYLSHLIPTIQRQAFVG